MFAVIKNMIINMNTEFQTLKTLTSLHAFFIMDFTTGLVKYVSIHTNTICKAQYSAAAGKFLIMGINKVVVYMCMYM